MDLLQKHALDCEIRGFCKTTTSTYKGHIKHFLATIQDPFQVSNDELRQVMEDLHTKKYHSSTFAGYWAAVNDFYPTLTVKVEVHHRKRCF